MDVVWDPAFLITEDISAPLTEAQVHTTWPNGTWKPFQDTLGKWLHQPTHVLPGNYGFTVLWKDVTVAQANIYVIQMGHTRLKHRFINSPLRSRKRRRPSTEPT